MIDPAPGDSPKKLVSHDGRLQFIYREDVHRDSRGNIYDLVICSWCQKQVFLHNRRYLKKALKGVDLRKLPNCGCQVRDTQAVVTDYKTDMTVREIAKKHGCSPQTVLRIARAAGVPPKVQSRNGGRVVTRYRIVAEILLTCDTLKVAEKLGTTRQKVRKAINEYMTLITKPPVG